jgi:hypothetical protein
VESNTVSRRRLVILGAVLLIALAGVGVLFLVRGPQDPADAFEARCRSYRDRFNSAVESTTGVVNTFPLDRQAWDEARAEAKNWQAALDNEGCPR